MSNYPRRLKIEAETVDAADLLSRVKKEVEKSSQLTVSLFSMTHGGAMCGYLMMANSSSFKKDY